MKPGLRPGFLVYACPQMDTSLFDFHLPAAHIAQHPVEPRDASRLLVLERRTGAVQHAHFRDLPTFLGSRDLVVHNDTRVLPVQVQGRKPTGGRVELLLLDPLDTGYQAWTCLIRGSVSVDLELMLDGKHGMGQRVRVTEIRDDGVRVITSDCPLDPTALGQLGQIPLPPYIKDFAGDRERYQTVYARVPGSAAAPTAGLHFTSRLLEQLRDATAGVVSVTLHVGRDTFAPVRSRQLEDHGMQGEQAAISQATADAINHTRRQGGRIVSVGTTTTRTLEWAAHQPVAGTGFVPLPALAGQADLYIWPGFRFQMVDAIVTNLHLPRSTPLFMISAFISDTQDHVDAGRRILLDAYREAIGKGYRFYSFGDAMLIV